MFPHLLAHLSAQSAYYTAALIVLCGTVFIRWLRHEMRSTIAPTNVLLFEIRDNHLKHLGEDLKEVKSDVKDLQQRVTKVETVL